MKILIDKRYDIIKVFPETIPLYEKIDECGTCGRNKYTTEIWQMIKSLPERDLNSLNLTKKIQDYINGVKPKQRRFPPFVRPACKDCMMKHLSQARILLSEVLQNYPQHFWLAVGHLAEASEEIIKENIPLANKIRQIRLDLMDNRDNENAIQFCIDKIDELMNEET